MTNSTTRFPLFEEALDKARDVALDSAGVPLERRAELKRTSVTPGPDESPASTDDNLPPDVEARLTQLETRASTLEMNAERLEDADNPAGAQHAREEAVKVRAEFDALAQAHGFDPYEDPEEGWTR